MLNVIQNLQFKIGIIGLGVMGQIFVDRLLKTKTINKSQILISRRYDNKKTLVNQCQIIILAVKPQDFKSLSDEMRGPINSKKSILILSIMAGVEIRTIQKLLGVKTIVRAIPNLPAKIRHGVTVWKPSKQVSQKQKKQVKKILQSLGTEIEVKNEKAIDLATVISGSGPAYVFLFYELMIRAGQNLGLSKRLTDKLVSETILGAMNLQRKLKIEPQILREQVASKGGTTAAALAVFEKYHLPEIFNRALQSAFKRSQEIKKYYYDQARID